MIDWLLLLSVFIIWWLYAAFAKAKAKTSYTVASALHRHRYQWVRRMLTRDNRMSDVSIVRGVEQSVIFFASSALLVIGALLTTVAGDESVMSKLTERDFHYWLEAPTELKLMVISVVFIRAFFHLTWGVRQYNMLAVLIGGAPTHQEVAAMGEESVDRIASSVSRVADRAGHAFNYGLRSWYFAMSFGAWLISAWLMVLSAIIVAMVLYRREFHSKSLTSMIDALEATKPIDS